MYTLERSDDEIDAVLNACSESMDAGRAKWPGMTYEQGVRAGIDWVTGQQDDNPMDE